jgi:hypothetical protein
MCIAFYLQVQRAATNINLVLAYIRTFTIGFYVFILVVSFAGRRGRTQNSIVSGTGRRGHTKFDSEGTAGRAAKLFKKSTRDKGRDTA